MKDIAKRVFDTEIESLRFVADAINDDFSRVVEAILQHTGKLIVIGIGKSGIIGKKIAATFASTGTPSFFLHPGEAFHGDLGMVGTDDMVILISYSGETDEVLKLIPFLEWNKNTIIGITGNPNSTVARNSHYHLNIGIKQEACPLALAPTSSTTAALVMGDALAVALMECRQFQHEDFARFHPGGSLGRKLLVRVKDLMRTDKLPFISENASFTELLLKMSEGRLGMVIVGNAGDVKGIITDGDLRRALFKNPDTTQLTVTGMMTKTPVFIGEDEIINNAEQLMIEKKIATVLVGSSEDRTVSGIYQIYNQ
ncbi:SIS domain-containing protein [Mucilaginibacter sp. L3T2-6]|uniref:KpsF/GutQ family sugar-phosphate isomerase n=1 Tax=Mucilaginibacter sp. L3T2-6 TaxID=3062491 RepID=UPI0026754AB2|nr:KpsF/GutQ family sugar-phosphate isomerase [Mucilaginibacter sp. L3T2-6]MDO3642894.1 KpsF/GutQ family sugar-phosphate isomerase [Mucilaginibacter sp. L3T2-6]MDV6215219.1 KpsF/GutQ family sugar-phosphate isomerase [Mucilaginibacter sp. L3T2-6]